MLGLRGSALPALQWRFSKLLALGMRTLHSVQLPVYIPLLLEELVLLLAQLQ
jgi:hypothetical protein